MSDVSNHELGDTLPLTHMIDTMRRGKLEIKYSDKPIILNKKLGGGGTKTVYDALIDTGLFALAVPNTVDGVEVMLNKWQVALKEPQNTTYIRNLGLFTNPECESLPININGVNFTAIKMIRYQDLPFPIMDGKDPYASTVKSNVLPENLDDSMFENLMSSVLPDVKVLIQNGIRLGKDSFNICLVDGKPRIYFADLGNMEIKPFHKKQVPSVVLNYIEYTYNALVQGLTEEEYQHHKAFFNGENFKHNSPNNMKNRLARKLIT